MSPSDVVGAGMDQFPEHFAGLETGQQERFFSDMKSEDNALKPLREKCRLDRWFDTVLDKAKRDFEEELAEETKAGANMIDAGNGLYDIEKEIKATMKQNAEKKLHSKPRYQPSKKMNGNVVGTFRSSVKQY